MKTLTLLLALCEGNPLVTSGFPSQKASNVELDISFVMNLNKLLNKQSICRHIHMIHVVSLDINRMLYMI